jgi:hypothetical protein
MNLKCVSWRLSPRPPGLCNIKLVFHSGHKQPDHSWRMDRVLSARDGSQRCSTIIYCAFGPAELRWSCNAEAESVMGHESDACLMTQLYIVRIIVDARAIVEKGESAQERRSKLLQNVAANKLLACLLGSRRTLRKNRGLRRREGEKRITTSRK